jgi:hypothetical protein
LVGGSARTHRPITKYVCVSGSLSSSGLPEVPLLSIDHRIYFIVSGVICFKIQLALYLWSTSRNSKFCFIEGIYLWPQHSGEWSRSSRPCLRKETISKKWQLSAGSSHL